MSSLPELNGFRICCALGVKDTCCQTVSIIAGLHQNTLLQQDVPSVVFVIAVVDGATGFDLTSSQDCFVDMVPVKAVTAVLG